MKILVLQLARLGDIFQTWPVLSALKRQNGEAEIHLLTREKFASATEGHPALHRHWSLDTRDILTPLIDEKPGLDLAMGKLDEFIAQLGAEKFDRIINLSFSPFSSFFAYEVAAVSSGSVNEIKGYTRFEDGYLNIPDDGSAYFYAQVGVGRPNRLHVTDLFAYVAGTELREEDWNVLPQHEPTSAKGTGRILLHVGASVAHKTLSPSKWQMVAKMLLAKWPGEVVLVGSPEEQEIAQQIEAISGERRPVNLVGQTSLSELIALVREARLLIGGDSGPVQIASLVNTPVLNVSFQSVSFWETGPRSKGSRILPVVDESMIAAEEIVDEALLILNGGSSKGNVVRVPDRTSPYVEMRPQPLAFEWEILHALYMSGEFPHPPSDIFLSGVSRFHEVNRLALEQIEALGKDPTNKTASLILEQSDALMDQVVSMVPELAPVLRWFRTERLRIGPMPVQDLVIATESVHRRLEEVIGIYMQAGEAVDDNVNME